MKQNRNHLVMRQFNALFLGAAFPNGTLNDVVCALGTMNDLRAISKLVPLARDKEKLAAKGKQ